MNKKTKEVVKAGVKTVSCDGGKGPLGHPKVYLEMKEEGVVCPYCSKKFVF